MPEKPASDDLVEAIAVDIGGPNQTTDPPFPEPLPRAWPRRSTTCPFSRRNLQGRVVVHLAHGETERPGGESTYRCHRG